MKKRVLMLALVILIVGVLSVTSNATSTSRNTNSSSTQTITEESVKAMVDESVEASVEGAISQLNAANEAENAEEEKTAKANGIGMIAAAIATGLACIGSGIAVAVVASSAVGAISEDPSLLGKTIIFAGLAEGIAIYGLIISIMILNKI